MAEKVKIALNWAGSCGGCDVSLLDIEARILDLAGMADIVYWPVAMDLKQNDFLALPDKSVDFGLFNGAIRTSEHEDMAGVFRKKCRVLVAYGSCASFGGIPGLGNLFEARQIFDVAYQTTPSTENPDGVRPRTECTVDGNTLTLPVFLETVKSLAQVVDVDVFLPGCPPPTERILDLIEAVARYADKGEILPPGTVLASEKALCDACPRNEKRLGGRMTNVVRPHETIADQSQCFLDQGIVCTGIATRGGCAATCIQANMPCRGCFGPTADMLDPGAEAISAIGSIAGAANENDVAPHEMKKAVRNVIDPVGTFYRFTLPVGFLSRAITDKPTEEKA